MKSRQTLIILLLLLLGLAAGLVWKFWLAENSASSANSSTTKPAAPKLVDAPKPTPTHVAAVEAPKNDPAPAHDAPEPAQPASPFQNLKPGVTFTNPSRPAFPGGSSSDPNDVTDLGEVYFASGVPQQLSLNDGTPVTVTATLGVNGDVSLRVEMVQTTPNGGTSHMTMITGTQQGRTMTLGGPRGMSRIKITPRVN